MESEEVFGGICTPTPFHTLSVRPCIPAESNDALQTESSCYLALKGVGSCLHSSEKAENMVAYHGNFG